MDEDINSREIHITNYFTFYSARREEEITRTSERGQVLQLQQERPLGQ